MAQLFSSNTSPEYLKAMADAYAMYFPQQQTYNPQTQQTTTRTLTPEYQQALQQWYGAASSAPTAVIPSQQSVVGGLFQDLYPQTAMSQGGGREVVDQNPGWGSKTDAEKASFYRDNPMMGRVTQGLQSLFGLTTLGQLQNATFPSLVTREALIARGINPDNLGPLGGIPGSSITAPTAAELAGPLSGGWGARDAGGGGYSVDAPGGGINAMGGYSGQDNVGNRGDN